MNHDRQWVIPSTKPRRGPWPALRAPGALAAACAAMLGLARAGEPADGAAAAKPPRADKSQYNLFHPTPDDLLREFSSSRPDQTTGPRSVDAGHFYLETGVSYGLNLGLTRTDTWTAFQSTHFRAGLTNDVELELIYNGLQNIRTRTARPGGKGRSDRTVDGSGALTVRTRFALVGNDDKDAKFVFGIHPEVVLPTVSHHVASEYVQGDVILAATVLLPAGFSATLNLTPSVVRNAADTDYEFGLTSGMTLYHNIFRKQDRVQLYLEYYDVLVTGAASTDSRQADVGVRWRPLPNLQFDAGCNFGVSRDAPDYQPFVGIVTRF